LDTYSENDYTLISDELIKERLTTIQNNVVQPKFSPAVRSYINTYTVKKRDKVEEMLGRTLIYYPLFDQLLEEFGLPSDLKYLSVVESALNAHAVSRSGAVGLWQFMPPTGKEYGLRINSKVDERKDPEKATRAALTYLSKLHKRYGNWELALAAYNGGPGRVNRAVKRGRSKNFWRIRRYLPRETRAYIPAYIAATYISHFYEEHDLAPIYPNTEFQLTERVKVYEELTFEEIERITGTPLYIIEYLNPSYKLQHIPSNYLGNNLVLPQERMAVFRNVYQLPDSERQLYTVGERIAAPRKRTSVPVGLLRLDYKVEMGDKIDDVAAAFRCSTEDILQWNRLTSSQLRYGQELIIYMDKTIMQPITALDPIPMANAIPVLEKQTEEVRLEPVALPVLEKGRSAKKKKRRAKKSKRERYVKHKIKRGESLYTIAAQYEGVSINDIIELNSIDSAEAVRPGKKIKIKLK
jgi:membrane-bound lytic murein transglycosylase D